MARQQERFGQRGRTDRPYYDDEDQGRYGAPDDASRSSGYASSPFDSGAYDSGAYDSDRNRDRQGEANPGQYSRRYSRDSQRGGSPYDSRDDADRDDRYGGDFAARRSWRQAQDSDYRPARRRAVYAGWGSQRDNEDNEDKPYSSEFDGSGQQPANSGRYWGPPEDYGQQGQYGAGQFDEGRFGSRGDYSGNRWSGRDSSRASYQSGSFWRSGDDSSRIRSNRGRGPKGYERSDERLKEMICERLTEDHDIDASEISVDVSNREVTLSGTVGERQTKYQIEQLVDDCGCVEDIHNQIRVQRADMDDGSNAYRSNKHSRINENKSDASGSSSKRSGRTEDSKSH
jgi:hypothetical protein